MLIDGWDREDENGETMYRGWDSKKCSNMGLTTKMIGTKSAARLTRGSMVINISKSWNKTMEKRKDIET